MRLSDYYEISQAPDRQSFERRLVDFAHEMDFGLMSAVFVVDCPGRESAFISVGNTPTEYLEGYGNREDWAREMAGYDAVILPTAANLPPDAARLQADNDYFVTENLLTLRNTRIANLMGLCALTLPTGLASTGIMLMGQPFAEERLLRIGAAAELALV